MAPPKLFFMHVPKTAGSSFRRFLERSTRAAGGSVAERARDGIWSSESESYPSYEDFVAGCAAAARDCTLICGHYPYHVRALLAPETRVVTVLRDPVARCVSHVKHQMAYERSTAVRVPEPDVNAFLANPRNDMFLRSIANLTVKYLAFDGHPETLVERAALSLDSALERCLDAEFGFADDLEAFQHRLARDVFGLPPDPRVAHENRSADPFTAADLAPANRQRLEALNEADAELLALLRRVADERWPSVPFDPDVGPGAGGSPSPRTASGGRLADEAPGNP